MKKKFSKFLGVGLALVLVCSFSLVTAVPVGAVTTEEYSTAVKKAADWLVLNQEDDGGFGWVLGSPPSHNVIGITAMGILKAHELEDKTTYETSLAKAYKFAVGKPPTYTWEVDKYIEDTPKGVDSFPDITFLVWLANAAADDESLLTAIQTQVNGTTATDIAALAKTRWDNRIEWVGSTQETPLNGTATSYAEWLRDLRDGQNLDALIPWDLGAGVKAALTLDFYYPGQGYDQQAVEIADVIHDSLYVEPVYFNPTEPIEMFINGISGALEAFVEVDLYSGKVTELKATLLQYQHDDGYWNYHDAGNAQMSVQDTAYAVMALLRQGDADSLVAAQKGADWLVSSQLGTGGWGWISGSTTEYAEIDSEAAWAIKVLLDISDSVSMIAAYIPSIGISVTPLAVDFGSLIPGAPSTPVPVTVTNIGNVPENFSASVINESHEDVYTVGLKMDANPVGEWGVSGVPPEGFSPPVVAGTSTPELILTVPLDTDPGTYTATLVFWAEMAP